MESGPHLNPEMISRKNAASAEIEEVIEVPNCTRKVSESVSRNCRHLFIMNELRFAACPFGSPRHGQFVTSLANFKK